MGRRRAFDCVAASEHASMVSKQPGSRRDTEEHLGAIEAPSGRRGESGPVIGSSSSTRRPPRAPPAKAKAGDQEFSIQHRRTAGMTEARVENGKLLEDGRRHPSAPSDSTRRIRPSYSCRTDMALAFPPALATRRAAWSAARMFSVPSAQARRGGCGLQPRAGRTPGP
jgi:hypothetical protein